MRMLTGTSSRNAPFRSVCCRHVLWWLIFEKLCREGLDGEDLDGEDLDGQALDGEALDGEELDGDPLDSSAPQGLSLLILPFPFSFLSLPRSVFSGSRSFFLSHTLASSLSPSACSLGCICVGTWTYILA